MTYSITNAGSASFPSGWQGYRVCASYDRKRWFRVANTEYKAGVLRWVLRSTRDTVWFAYFAPYSYERHQDLVGRCALAPSATVTVLGSTLAGRPLDLVTVGAGPRQVWVCARQHPGESMAEWFAEGLLEALLHFDAVATSGLLGQATIHVLPNLNPDGAALGHLRTNARGADLNQEWAPRGRFALPHRPTLQAAPTLERSPEVLHTLRALDRHGCDLFVDVHGDECVPGPFLIPTSGIPGWTPRLERLYGAFHAAMAAASPGLRTEGGGAPNPQLRALSLGPNQIAQRFDCLAVTLEMPFKADPADPAGTGCTPDRAKALGQSLLGAVQAVLPILR